MVDADFPLETFSRLGYETERIGQRTYNGVAIVSRHPLSDVHTGLSREQATRTSKQSDAASDSGARLISAKAKGVSIFCAYVPNGKSLDSPDYPTKLKWLAQLKTTLEQRCAAQDPVVVCGDFNIARDERDVFDPAAMAGKMHFSAPEHEALDDLISFGLFDTFRSKNEEPGHFSWWDYRMGAFRRNRGLRIDYIFATLPLRERLLSASIDKTPRTWPKPSDHAPTVIELADPS